MVVEGPLTPGCEYCATDLPLLFLTKTHSLTLTHTHTHTYVRAHTHTHSHTHTHTHTHVLLASASHRLASYDIVLTTYGLVASEWQATSEDSGVRLCCHGNILSGIIKALTVYSHSFALLLVE